MTPQIRFLREKIMEKFTKRLDQNLAELIVLMGFQVSGSEV